MRVALATGNGNNNGKKLHDYDTFFLEPEIKPDPYGNNFALVLLDTIRESLYQLSKNSHKAKLYIQELQDEVDTACTLLLADPTCCDLNVIEKSHGILKDISSLNGHGNPNDESPCKYIERMWEHLIKEKMSPLAKRSYIELK